MSTRGAVQRCKEHWRNYLMSPQGHELPHCGLITKNCVFVFVMNVMNFFVGMTTAALAVSDRRAITCCKTFIDLAAMFNIFAVIWRTWIFSEKQFWYFVR